MQDPDAENKALDSSLRSTESQSPSLSSVNIKTTSVQQLDGQASKDASAKEYVGHYSDQHHIDAECDRLLKNTKKQVKQMMEEAVTKKFIHEESCSIMSLCVAVDACISHGLKRRALGLFKTNSSTALIQKVAKSCKVAQEVLDAVGQEEKRITSAREQVQRRESGKLCQVNSNSSGGGSRSAQRSPIRATRSNQNVHKRNGWIKYALIDKKLVTIIDHLAENSAQYYEPSALMANRLCAQILSSLLMGPSALEFSRSKTHNYYQFEDPTADELLKRHKLANPIACLCYKQQQHSAPVAGSHTKLSRSATDGQTAIECRLRLTASSQKESETEEPKKSVFIASSPNNKQQVEPGLNSETPTTGESPSRRPQHQQQSKRRSPSPARSLHLVRTGSGRRRPLALKTSTRRGTLVTDCHHYSCQEISERHQARGYTFVTSASSGLPNSVTGDCNQQTGNCNSTAAFSPNPLATSSSIGRAPINYQDWSPRILHETLHQNSKSILLYAKNNILLETQSHETIAGYLSLHQTNSDLILRWIPNQMINGGHVVSTSSPSQKERDSLSGGEYLLDNFTPDTMPNGGAVESSYLDLVLCLSVSRIVLLHCQFAKNHVPSGEKQSPSELSLTKDQQKVPSDLADSQKTRGSTNLPVQELGKLDTEETLILVEADGIQRAPFKFPKGGLRLFLYCLENGLRPDKYLDPAIRFDDGPVDPLHSLQLVNGETSEGQNDASSQQASRLELLLKRLPSLKSRSASKQANEQANEKVTTPKSESLEAPAADVLSCPPGSEPTVQQKETDANPPPSPSNYYIYRIVSSQQPDWQLPTPPHSALSAGFSSASSQQTVSVEQSQRQTPTSGQMFRWSLSKLARFSAKYTTGSTTSSSSATNGNCAGNDDRGGSNQLSHQQTGDSISEDVSFGPRPLGGGGEMSPDEQSSRDLARIEAKLDDLKKSSSDEILALRTQSIQTLCESMRRQIVARAFYGWLAYCRKVRIIRNHLLKLLNEPSRCHLVDVASDEDDDDDDEELDDDRKQRLAELSKGLTRERWSALLTNETKLKERELCREVNLHVYYGGVEDDELRREVWPYLLGHYKFTDSKDKRRVRDEWARESYAACGRDWIEIERVVKQRDNEILAANMAKAKRDALNGGEKSRNRTVSETSDEIGRAQHIDSNNNDNEQSDITEGHEMDSCDEPAGESEKKPDAEGASGMIGGQEDSTAPAQEDEIDTSEIKQAPAGQQQSSVHKMRNKNYKEAKMKARRKKRRPRLESTGSVGSDASITDQFGNNIHRIDKDVQRCDRNFWYFKETKNLVKLHNIMCTYVWQHLDVGYVQGMCDLAAPFLVIFDDEVMAHACFSQLMRRLEANFPHGSAMDQHFESLKYLMQILDPKLFEIFQSNGDYTHFYFCYRWLLLDFKRELAYEDVYRVWETIWSARTIVTDHFVVFMALAMVRYYRDIIIENNMDFTDTIKFFNEMAERHDAIGITALARDCIVELIKLTKS